MRQVGRGPLDGDAFLDADRLAKLAADAFFLVHNGDLEEFGVVMAGLHGNAVEGADIDAKFAGRAGFRVHLGLRDGRGFYFLHDVAQGVNDGLDRAVDAADAAIDAKGRINVMEIFLVARDGFGGTFDRAEGTADAIIQNDVRHERSPKLKERNLTA